MEAQTIEADLAIEGPEAESLKREEKIRTQHSFNDWLAEFCSYNPRRLARSSRSSTPAKERHTG